SSLVAERGGVEPRAGEKRRAPPVQRKSTGGSTRRRGGTLRDMKDLSDSGRSPIVYEPHASTGSGPGQAGKAGPSRPLARPCRGGNPAPGAASAPFRGLPGPRFQREFPARCCRYRSERKRFTPHLGLAERIKDEVLLAWYHDGTD